MALLRRGKCVRSLPENKKRVVDEKLFNVKCSHGFFLSNVASNWSAWWQFTKKKCRAIARWRILRLNVQRSVRQHCAVKERYIWNWDRKESEAQLQQHFGPLCKQVHWVLTHKQKLCHKTGWEVMRRLWWEESSEMYKYVVWELSRMHICRRCSFIRQRTSNTTQIPNFQEITQRT